MRARSKGPRSIAAALFLLAVFAAADEKAKPSVETGLPLAATRTIRFTTDEGTWMSLDVSPDGSLIVFDLVGDLYTLPIGGGSARRITSGLPFDSQPRFSPDGRQIVFVSDRDGSPNLWIVDRDGAHPRALTHTKAERYSSPAWLPDGRAVVAVHSDTMLRGVLMFQSLEGGTGVPLTLKDGVGPRPMISGPAVGGDSRYLYAATGASGISTSWEDPTWQISRIDRLTGMVRAQTPVGRRSMRPAVSPDGRTLAYVAESDKESILMLRDIASGGDRILARDMQWSVGWNPENTRDVFPGYAFTPDGRAIVVTNKGKLWRIDVASGAQTAIPFTADVELHLGPLSKFEYTEDTPEIVVRQIRSPQVSSDGARVVFSALDRLWVADVSGGPPRRLTEQDVIEDEPVWSPDGRSIAYVTWDDRAGGAVCRVSAAGGAPEALTHDAAYYEKPAYSADGSTIIAQRGPARWRSGVLDYLTLADERGTELVSLPAAGGTAAPLPFLSGAEQFGYQRAQFTGGNRTRFLVYSPARGLVSMRLDGSDARILFKVVTGDFATTGEVSTLTDAIVSPDERHALVNAWAGLYLISLPPGGPYPESIDLSTPGDKAVPVKIIGRLGGDYAGWSRDGKSFYYSLGHSLFLYDLDRAREAVARGSRYEPTRRDLTVTVPRDKPTGTLVLRGARLLTMRGTEVIEDGDIVIVDNLIRAVGRHGSFVLPSGARTIDVSGKTILPGYVDLHGHVALKEARGIHANQPWTLLAHLAFGVTTIRDPQTQVLDTLTYEDRVAAGDVVGPRYLSTGPGIFSPARITSLQDARDTVRRYSEFYGLHTIKQYDAGPRNVRQWLVMAAREFRVTPTNEGDWDGLKDLTYAFDGYGGLEHAIPEVPFYKDTLELLAGSGMTYDPTLFPMSGSYFYRHYDIHADSKLRHFFPHQFLDRIAQGGDLGKEWYRDASYVIPTLAASLAKVVAAGGRVSMGAHGDAPGIGDHFELWAIASGGMPPYEVLRAGTYAGAEGIGLGKELGTLEPGKLADLQILDRNPLEDIHNTNSVRWVMKNGRLYDASTLDEIWPRQRKLPPMWWFERDSAEGSR